MKVLEVNTVCGIRSTGRICTDLADVLKENGHQCTVAYGREIVPEKYKSISKKIGTASSAKTDGLLTRIFDNAGFNSKKETKAFVKWVKEYNPDIIHLHNIHGYYINIEILFNYLKESGKPVIWTLHDCWAFTGHCSHFTVVGCDKWKTGCYSCPKIKSYPKSMFLDNSKTNYRKKKELFTSLDNLTVVTPSKWLASKAKESFLGKYRIIDIPNGVDLNVFKETTGDFRKRYNLVNKKIVLGAATAWSNTKGLWLFGELSKVLDDSFKVVLVGITDKIKSMLPDTVLALKRTNSVREMAEIYTTADVFLNLGREETMGLTTVEAMACGTPVVTSNCTAVPEVVTDDGGIVLENLEIETIISGIRQVLSTEYKDTRVNALKYEKKQQYLKYLELYNNII